MIKKLNELRKLVILGCHPGKTYEDINENDFDKEGCQAFSDICGKKDKDGKWLCGYCRRWNGQQRIVKRYLPITLGRVLQALGQVTTFSVEHFLTKLEDSRVGINIAPNQSGMGTDYFYWLLTVDGRTATIEDQTEETVEKLLELLRENSEFPNY